MKHLLLTTALVSLIAAVPVSAQTTDTTGAGTEATTGGTFTPPEGYTPFETATLTVEDLQGATVYDANGESVGEISDFVFAGGGVTGSATGTTTDSTAMTDGTGTTTDTATTTDSATTTDTTAGTDAGAASDTASETGADTSGSVTGDATTMAEGTADTDTTAGESDTDVAATGNATDTTAGTGTEATTDTAMDDTATTTTDNNAAGTDMASTEAQEEVDVSSGSISHVVLDVGGFLGIGTHTVAVPLEELQVFRDDGNNLRVYLPWTEAQLEAVPEFDENNPDSLDATDDAPATGGTTTGG